MNKALQSIFDSLLIIVVFLGVGIGVLYLVILGFIWLWGVNQLLAIAALLFLILIAR